MNLTKIQWWERFQKYYTEFPEIGLAIDLSRMNVDESFFVMMETKIQKALSDMAVLEKGGIANPDENRMVGHYWLRNPKLAPTVELQTEIEQTLTKIKNFTQSIHSGEIHGASGPFKNYLLIGIGGSALGPQFVANALGNPRTDKLKPYFFDNTDPDGMDRVLAMIGKSLGRTLCIVVSKSGGTNETQNGMLTAKSAYEAAGLNFGEHSVAVTSANSGLDKYAIQNKWLERFPMWDWIGGRTSEFSTVGLLPAGLQGFDINYFLSGACECDKVTRSKNIKFNPACQLAIGWYASGNGKGLKNMVILPYKDRLEVFSKYLQQLLMESLGKAHDLNGNLVNQGITVLGNKGATDQHSYVQQLRDGLNDFFAIFVEVLNDGEGRSLEVEPRITAGDFLSGFYLGTRQALSERNRESITLTIDNISPFSIGMLIALFERTVGIYASLININAYHQPGVEAGKKAAAAIIQTQIKILELLAQQPSQGLTVIEIAKKISADDDIESVFKICEHLSANPNSKIQKYRVSSSFSSRYTYS